MFENSRSVYVSVAHRYWNPHWSGERNRKVYGRDASAEGVGSNLILRLSCSTAASGEADLRPCLHHLKELCDHRCFFTDFSEMRDCPSTLESVAQFLGAKAFAQPPPAGARWSCLTVFEGENLSCTVRPDRPQVELCERLLNLQIVTVATPDPDSRLSRRRGQTWEAVKAIAPWFAQPAQMSTEAWAGRLFETLQSKVKDLREVEIDLSSHRRYRVSAPT